MKTTTLFFKYRLWESDITLPIWLKIFEIFIDSKLSFHAYVDDI